MKRKILNFTILSIILAWTISSCDFGSDIPSSINTPESEKQKLEVYLDSLLAQGYDIDTTEIGVYYVTIEEGEGPYPKTGDTLLVGYSGYLINGFLFDSSDMYEEDGKWEFELGNPPSIEGWDNGMSVINKGAKVQLMIPSELAYGESGFGIIKPYETLIFVVEMFDIKPSD